MCNVIDAEMLAQTGEPVVIKLGPGTLGNPERVEVFKKWQVHPKVMATFPDQWYIESCAVVSNKRNVRRLADERHDNRIPDFGKIWLVAHIIVRDVMNLCRESRVEIHLSRMNQGAARICLLSVNESDKADRAGAVLVVVRGFKIDGNVIKFVVHVSNIAGRAIIW